MPLTGFEPAIPMTARLLRPVYLATLQAYLLLTQRKLYMNPGDDLHPIHY